MKNNLFIYYFKLFIGKVKKDYEQLNNFEKFIVLIREILIILVLFLLIIRPLIFSSYYVPTGSMEKTIMTGSLLFGSPLVYGGYVPIINYKLPGLKKIKRGDIVIFKYPVDPKRIFVKRVIGLPGEKVEIIGKTVFINGEPLNEPYVQFIQDPFYEAHPEIKRPNFGPVIVPEGQYFVMGDNRDNSADSRVWGFLPKENIFSAPLIIYFSIDPQTKKVRWKEIFKVVYKK